MPDKGSAGSLTLALGRLSGMLRRDLTRRLGSEPWVAEAELRPPSFAVLSLIGEHQPVSQKQVSDHLSADPSDLVAIFDGLERAGLISRDRDPDDRRRYSLTLTSHGAERLGRFREIAAEITDEIFAPLTAAERETLRRLLQRVVEHHAP
ncbi:MAG: MarR family winged helix-turn-helix transcriptional regulator [Acidimicrobiia bacterium]